MMLPQFKDYDGKCRLNGPLCKACRSPYHADWREAQTGMREFACPFDKAPKVSPNGVGEVKLTPPKEKTDTLQEEMVEVKNKAKELFNTYCTTCPEYRGEQTVLSVRCHSSNCRTCGRFVQLKIGKCPEKKF